MHNVCNTLDNAEEERKREFKRQQDRLKMLTPDTERKIVTADSMIDSLLQKSDTFKKSPAQNYPNWLRINTPQSCPYYEQIWNTVCISDKLVDTNRISQLLLTSGLHPDILGYIWNLANKATPGQLNKQELFVVLSLVGLAQSGCSFNSVEVLNSIPSAPIPRLSVPYSSNFVTSPNVPLSTPRLNAVQPIVPSLTPGLNPVQPMGPSLTPGLSPVQPIVPSLSPGLNPVQPIVPSLKPGLSQVQHNFPNSINVGTSVANVQLTSLSGDDDFQDFQFASVPSTTFSQASTISPASTSIAPPLDVRLQSTSTFTTSKPNTALLGQATGLSEMNKVLNNSTGHETTLKSLDNTFHSPTLDFARSPTDWQQASSDATFQKTVSSLDSVRSLTELNVSNSQLRPQKTSVDISSYTFSNNEKTPLESLSSIRPIEPLGTINPVLSQNVEFKKELPVMFDTGRNQKTLPQNTLDSVKTTLSSAGILPHDSQKPSDVPFHSAPTSVLDSVRSATEPNLSSRLQQIPLPKTEVEADEFAEFQSADAFDTSIVQPSKMAMPKLSSFIRVSPESERKLRHLTQSESLSVLPESKISSRNQVSKMPSISLMGSSRNVGNRLANHSLASKSEKIKHHQKVMKVKPIVSASSASVPPEELFPKCLSKNSAFLLKETKIPSTDLEEDLSDHTRRIEIPSVGTFKETTLPVDMKTSIGEKSELSSEVLKSNNALLQVEEDKYGALRELELFQDEKSKEVPEDFGEFLSADLPTEKAVEAWSAWNSSIIPENSETVFEKEPKIDKQPMDLLSECFSSLEFKNEDIARVSVDESKVDEFGDFVTTFNNVKIVKEASIDKSSSSPSLDFSRRDSWSSLETPGDFSGKSRKESTPSLNFQMDVSSQQIANRCLNCCYGLLKEAVDIFTSVSDKAVLQEIFESSQAKDYLKHLKIVYSIAKRINENEIDCSSLFDDIRDLWQQLEIMAPDTFSLEFGLPAENSGSLKPCVVCKGLTSDLDIEKDGSRFHPSCANLWVNCIESTLPSS